MRFVGGRRPRQEKMEENGILTGHEEIVILPRYEYLRLFQRVVSSQPVAVG